MTNGAASTPAEGIEVRHCAWQSDPYCALRRIPTIVPCNLSAAETILGGAMTKRRRVAVGCGVATAGSALLALIPSVASATGPDNSCGAQEFCISKSFNTEGGSDTYMTYGWTTWYTASTISLLDQKYSNDGSTVAGAVYSIRSRDTINGRTMCIYESQAGGIPSYLQRQAKFYGETWKNLGAYQTQQSYIFRKNATQGNCPTFL